MQRAGWRLIGAVLLFAGLGGVTNDTSAQVVYAQWSDEPPLTSATYECNSSSSLPADWTCSGVNLETQPGLLFSECHYVAVTPATGCSAAIFGTINGTITIVREGNRHSWSCAVVLDAITFEYWDPVNQGMTSTITPRMTGAGTGVYILPDVSSATKVSAMAIEFHGTLTNSAGKTYNFNGGFTMTCERYSTTMSNFYGTLETAP